jgi:hypothetical protein
MAHATVQEIMRRGYEAYQSAHPLPYHVRKAARALMICRTAELGGHREVCPEGHYQRHWYNSCRHRFCPQCTWAKITEWLERQKERLLPCGHYHAIFTLPHDLNDLWLLNVKAMTGLLFACMRDTLFEFFLDPTHRGATPGIIATLHTWSQTMVLHIHLHCLIAEGGLFEGQWRETHHRGYLLPMKAVMTVFRGTFLAYVNKAVEHGMITLPPGMTFPQWKNLKNKLGRTKWDVWVQDRYEHGKGVLIYLSRYVRGGAMSDRRITSTTDEGVTFTYKNRDRSASHPMTLPVDQFLQRYLLHVPAPHTKIVRYYGLYATTATDELALCRSSLGECPPDREEIEWQPPRTVYPDCCPVCGRPFVHYIDPPHRKEVIPYAA